MAEQASINIEYEPNWENAHVKKRLDKVLTWASQYVVGNRGTTIPVQLSSVKLNQVFGPTGKQLSDYLRAKLLKLADSSYSTEKHYCKTYHVLLEGFNELSQREMAESSLANAYVDTSLVLNKLRQVHAEELTTGRFKMHDAADRLWHPLQNLRRTDKLKFWAEWLPYNYDIEACAPSILMQVAEKSGMPSLLADAIRIYVDTKGELRQHVADLTGLSLENSKRLINSLFNGAKLAKNPRCSLFQLLEFDKDKMDALVNDNQIKALRFSIKCCWKAIETRMQAESNRNTRVSLAKAKVKWGIYFRLERRVLNAITRELDAQGIRYFTEHDGFRTDVQPDIERVQDAIFKATGLRLKIKGD